MIPAGLILVLMLPKIAVPPAEISALVKAPVSILYEAGSKTSPVVVMNGCLYQYPSTQVARP